MHSPNIQNEINSRQAIAGFSIGSSQKLDNGCVFVGAFIALLPSLPRSPPNSWNRVIFIVFTFLLFRFYTRKPHTEQTTSTTLDAKIYNRDKQKKKRVTQETIRTEIEFASVVFFGVPVRFLLFRCETDEDDDGKDRATVVVTTMLIFIVQRRRQKLLKYCPRN